MVAYSFDLRTNEIDTTRVPNPGGAGNTSAYRLAGDPADVVTLRDPNRVLAELNTAEAADDEDD